MLIPVEAVASNSSSITSAGSIHRQVQRNGRIATGGITLTIHDLAKIGRLYLNNGQWNGKRIVSEDWIRQTADCDTSYHGYHFNWYNINYEDYTRPQYSGYYALGICEQVLYVNPHKNLVIVRIGISNSGPT